MKRRRSHVAYLRDMLDAVEQAALFTAGMTYDDFVADRKSVFAVARALEIVGEASKKLPKSVRDRHPEVPWAAIAGTRDRLIHGYFEVDTEIIWRTIIDDLPALKPILQALLSEADVAEDAD